MRRVLRLALPSLAAVIAACVSTPSPTGSTFSTFGERPTPYGAFLAARYADAIADAESASVYYQLALAQEPGNLLIARRAFAAALAAGDMDAAVKLAGEAATADPNDRLARLVLAVEDMRAKRYRKVRARLEPGGLGPFNRVVGAGVLAWAAAAQGDDEAALKALRTPPDAPILGHLLTLHRALILARAGRDAEADAAFETAWSEGFLAPVVLDAYGRRLERTGRTAQAKRIYQDRLAAAPEDVVAKAGLARIAAGRKPAAFAADPRQGAATAIFGPAATLAANAESDLAAAYLRLALHLDPASAPAREALGGLYARAERHGAAYAVFAGGPSDAPGAVNARISAAWALLQLDRREEAAAKLASIAEATGSRRARLLLGDAHRDGGDYASAAAVFSQVIADIEGAPAESDWTVFFARGAALERMGRWPEAEADLLTALALSPDQPSVLNYLGYTWVDRGENIDEAFAMIRRAVRLQPDAGYIVDSLGWAYFRMGRFDDAVRELERAVGLDPQDPTINDHLGDAYWRVGRLLEARYQWRRALTLEPEPELRGRLEAKVDAGLDVVDIADNAPPPAP